MTTKARTGEGPLLMMVPPLGFTERAVARALALVQAEERLVVVDGQGLPQNDVRAHPRPCRRRHDSAVIDTRALVHPPGVRERSER